MPITSHTIRVQQLFLQHHQAVRTFVFSLLPDFAAAEDVIQETFLVVTEKADDYQEGSNFVAWACVIARFELLKSRRKYARLMFTPEVIDVMADDLPIEQFSERRLQILRDCLHQLPAHAGTGEVAVSDRK